MNLVVCNKAELENLDYYKKSNVLKLIDEFAESDMDCARIEGSTHKTSNSCQNSFNNAIKRYKKSGIRCVQRSGACYLIKETTK